MLPHRQPHQTLMPMKSISVKLSEPVASWLVRRGKETKRSRSAIVREALERERSGNGRPKSCRDLLGDLDGFFDGPPNLSTNPKHMEGFGQ